MKARHIVLCVLIFFLPFVLVWPKMVTKKAIEDDVDNLKVIVLNYHKIDHSEIALSVAPAEFEKQMAYLSAKGYHTITPDELVDYMEGGIVLPPNPVLITFDDGYADNYANAYPVLKKYGFKATIFVITDYLNLYPTYITWAQAKEMSQHGITIASHTMQHKSMITLTKQQLRDELQGSADAINAHIGERSQFVAYPTGTYDLQVAEMVKECGYRAAFTIKYGNVDKASNIYALERVPIFRTGDTFESFLERIRYLPFFERLGWIKM